MKQHESWGKIVETKTRGQRQKESALEDSGAEITIHMENVIWYPEYY